MNRDLVPTSGARFLFERERDEGARARYRVVVYTPDTSYEGHATLGEDGSVELALDAPEALAGAAAMFAKLVARSAAKKREEGLPAWPARVLRWRGPGRGE